MSSLITIFFHIILQYIVVEEFRTIAYILAINLTIIYLLLTRKTRKNNFQKAVIAQSILIFLNEILRYLQRIVHKIPFEDAAYHATLHHYVRTIYMGFIIIDLTLVTLFSLYWKRMVVKQSVWEALCMVTLIFIGGVIIYIQYLDVAVGLNNTSLSLVVFNFILHKIYDEVLAYAILNYYTQTEAFFSFKEKYEFIWGICLVFLKILTSTSDYYGLYSTLLTCYCISGLLQPEKNKPARLFSVRANPSGSSLSQEGASNLEQ